MACQEFRKEFDAVFPEHMSRLNRGSAESPSSSFRRQQRRTLHRETPTGPASGRYRTQPVTFDEIKEVDEEVIDEVRHHHLLQDDSGPVVQSEEDLMQRKFHQLRVRRRGSNRATRRPLLRASSSHDEVESESHSSSCCSPSQEQSERHFPST